MFKQFAKSKTMIFAALLAIFGVLEASFGVLRESLVPLMGESAFGIFTVLVSIIVALLRLQTTQSVGEK